MHQADACPGNQQGAEAKAVDVVVKFWTMKLKVVAELVDKEICEMLTFYAYPSQHKFKLKINNPMKRLLKQAN